MKTIAFDLDGVLSDFVLSFTFVGHVLFGKPIFGNGNQYTWTFLDIFTEEEIKAIWEKIKNSPRFWQEMPVLVTLSDKLAMWDLHKAGYDIAYVSNRLGIDPLKQSQTWLQTHGFPNPYSVYITEGERSKAVILEELDAVAHVDDSPADWERMMAAKALGHLAGTDLYRIVRRYNGASSEFKSSVLTVCEFCHKFLP